MSGGLAARALVLGQRGGSSLERGLREPAGKKGAERAGGRKGRQGKAGALPAAAATAAGPGPPGTGPGGGGSEPSRLSRAAGRPAFVPGPRPERTAPGSREGGGCQGAIEIARRAKLGTPESGEIQQRQDGRPELRGPGTLASPPRRRGAMFPTPAEPSSGTLPGISPPLGPGPPSGPPGPAGPWRLCAPRCRRRRPSRCRRPPEGRLAPRPLGRSRRRLCRSRRVGGRRRSSSPRCACAPWPSAPSPSPARPPWARAPGSRRRRGPRCC